MAYGKKIIDHFENPRNIGTLDKNNPNANKLALVFSLLKFVQVLKSLRLMNKNPFSNQRYEIARKNVINLMEILKSGDLDGFISITESDALMIHSLMLTSNPNYILIKPNTLKVISKITEFRTETKLPICFTLDAGSNVHLLYPENVKKKISDFIKVELILVF